MAEEEIIRERIKNMNSDITARLKEFLDNEARSGSMDYGCVTPLYVYRMFGGQYSIADIESGFAELRKQGFRGLKE